MIEYLIMSATVFTLGVFGVALNQKSLLTVLISLELILLGGNLSFLVFSVMLDDIVGQISSLLMLSIAGCETAIGLTIIIVFYAEKQNVEVDSVFLLS